MEPLDRGIRRVAQVDDDAVAAWLTRVTELYPDRVVYLFGSRARGEAWLESDYDFCVVSRGFEGLKPWERAERLAALWTLPVSIEIVAYTPDEWEATKDWTFPATVRAEGIRLT